jgi:hypothetical protein
MHDKVLAITADNLCEELETDTATIDADMVNNHFT